MKISMLADFRIYEREFERPNVFRQLSKEDVEDLSIGGFTFVVDGKSVHFDWDAGSCSEENGVFHLETGYGPFFNDFEIPAYWDEEYAEMGISREDITAEFLASATKIEEFFINAYDGIGSDEEIQIGDNTEANAQYFVELIAITLEERETGRTFDVDESVVKAFNKNAVDYHKILKTAYTHYKHEWCEARGFDYDAVAEADANNEEYRGQMYACLREFEDCEFADDDYMAGHFNNWFEKKLLYKNDGEPELRKELASEQNNTKESPEVEQELSVLIVEPGKAPYSKTIASGLKSLQHEVGGDIEAVYPFEEPIAIICNDEGKFEGLTLNRALRDEDGDVYDIIAGTFMVVGLADEGFGSLSPELNKQFSEYFKDPEKFVRFGDEIVAMPSDLDSKIREYAVRANRNNNNSNGIPQENVDFEAQNVDENIDNKTRFESIAEAIVRYNDCLIVDEDDLVCFDRNTGELVIDSSVFDGFEKDCFINIYVMGDDFVGQYTMLEETSDGIRMQYNGEADWAKYEPEADIVQSANDGYGKRSCENSLEDKITFAEINKSSNIVENSVFCIRNSEER